MSLDSYIDKIFGLCDELKKESQTLEEQASINLEKRRLLNIESDELQAKIKKQNELKAG